MKNVKHIRNIAIENFKCFDYFNVSDFVKYNLILGNNNVGKTSLLEALLFDENASQSITNFQAFLQFKRIITNSKAFTVNPFGYFINKYSNKNYIDVEIKFFNSNSFRARYEPIFIADVNEGDRIANKSFFENNTKDKEILKVLQNGTNIIFKSYSISLNFEKTTDFVEYVFSTSFYSDDLIDFYSENFANSKETKKELINNLKILIPNISDIEITLSTIDKEPIIGIWLEEKDGILPLPMFGDGTIRLFRMIMEIAISKNKYLCIDEIDTGIHFSRYKDVIRIILKSANQNNVQLFITTHNNEFLKAYKEVLEEKDFTKFQEETKTFSLKVLPKGTIKAYSYNFDEFEFAIEQENELR